MKLEKNNPYSNVIGNFRLVCNGKIILNQSGDHSVYYSILFILAPLVIILIFNSANIVHHIHWIFLVGLVVLNVATLYCLIRTWLTDPGIIMRDPTGDKCYIDEPTTLQRRVSGLMVSVKNSRIEYVTKTLAVYPELINEQNIEGRTLLHISCQYNKLDMTRCLFTYNPDITIRDAYGLLAIHYAVLANREELLEEFWKVLGITDEQAKEAKKQELYQEIHDHIPQYDFSKNVYYIDRQGLREEHALITEFFIGQSDYNRSDSTMTVLVTKTNEDSDSVTAEPMNVSTSTEGVTEGATSTEGATATAIEGATSTNVATSTEGATPASTTAVATATPSTSDNTQNPEAASPTNKPLTSYICLCNEKLVTVKRCSTCCIYTPPRAYHCLKCNACILTFDHHCPWVSNCVGRRNHKYFMWFLVLSELSCLYGIGTLVGFFVMYIMSLFSSEQGFDLVSFLIYTWPSLIYLICCVGFAVPIANLVIYHVRITSHNMTTHEDIALPPKIMKKRASEYYPYSEGCWKNMVSGMCPPYVDSLVNIQSV